MIFGFSILFGLAICIAAGIWEHWPEELKMQVAGNGC